MACCAVKICRNNRKFPPQGKIISFHLFPKGELQQVWLNKLGKTEESFVWTKNKVVCSEHFEEGDFIIRAGRKSLKFNAVPSQKLSQGQADSSSIIENSVSTSYAEETSISKIENTIFTSTSSVDEGTVKKHQRRKRKFLSIAPTKNISTTSTSTDSSAKRRRIQVVKSIHSYRYGANKQIKSLKKEVLNMKVVMEHVKNNQGISDNAVDHLEKTYNSVPQLLMNRYLKNIKNETITHETYPPVLREFAATLQFYSSKAYGEVRKQFEMSLPHQATIRKWYQSVNCEVGFVSVAFDALKQKVEEFQKLRRDVLCSLMLDEISIKKQLDFDDNRTWGYVNIGVPTENDELQPATEALVIMVVCDNGHWKIPIAYFFITSLSAKEKANIINESLIRLHEIGVIITSVTCDGPSTNIAMMRELGCTLDNLHQMKTWFYHPSDDRQKVFCILDACHMLKLMRNNFASLQQMKDPDGNIINWTYVKRLYELQEGEGLHIANKLKHAHMEWQRQKMKVHLAAQTLSNSIADAIDFLNKKMNIPEFQGSEATTAFIRKIDCLFDILNSRSPQAKGFKAPLRINNESVWRPFIISIADYLSRCTDVGGRPLWLTPKKTPFIGFCITALSVCGIFDEFVKSGKFNYLLTYKVSQDHLEIFFCSIRSKNGWNNNPTCLQFMRTFRRLLLHTKISQGEGNCKVLDATTILSIPSTTVKSTEETVDISIWRKYSYEPADHLLDHDYDIMERIIDLSALTSNIVTYISGYVLKMLEKIHACAECILGCECYTDAMSEDSYTLISFKIKGGLHVPSYGVIKICRNTEIAIRNMLTSTNNKIPKEKNFLNIFVTANAQKYYGNMYNLFPSLNDHFLECSPNDENHGFLLIKNIIRSHSKIRIFNLSKKYTETRVEMILII